MENTNTLLTLAKRTLISVGVSLAVGLAFLLGIAGALTGADDPDRLMSPLALFSLAFSSLLCGVLCGRQNKDLIIPDIAAGIAGGALLVGALFLLSAVPADGILGMNTGRHLLYRAFAVALAGIGAIVGKRKKRHRPSYGKVPKSVRRVNHSKSRR